MKCLHFLTVLEGKCCNKMVSRKFISLKKEMNQKCKVSHPFLLRTDVFEIWHYKNVVIFLNKKNFPGDSDQSLRKFSFAPGDFVSIDNVNIFAKFTFSSKKLSVFNFLGRHCI